MTRIMIVGQAPSRETDGKEPLSGVAGAFLAELVGLTHEELLRDHDCENVLARYPGKDVSKGDKFPVREAMTAAAGMLPRMAGRTVLMLGHNVARAFGCGKFQYFQPFVLEATTPDGVKVHVPWACVIPHPSRVNRWWNDPTNVMAAKKFLVALVRR